jgi:hypothetical protein
VTAQSLAIIVARAWFAFTVGLLGVAAVVTLALGVFESVSIVERAWDILTAGFLAYLTVVSFKYWKRHFRPSDPGIPGDRL